MEEKYGFSMTIDWDLTHRFAKIMRQATNVMHILKMANTEEWHLGVHNYTIMYLSQMDKIGDRLEKAMAAFEREVIEADKEVDDLFFKNKDLIEMGVDTHLWYMEREYQKNPQNYSFGERLLLRWWKWMRKDRLNRVKQQTEQGQ